MRTAKQDLARGVVAFNDPPRPSSALKALLIVGGALLIVGGLAVAALGVMRRRRPGAAQPA